MKIILLSDYENIPGEIQLVTKLFEHGLQYFHIRKRNYTFLELSDYINNIPSEYHKYCIVDEHIELARELGLMGVHFTKQNTIQKYAKANQMTVKEVIDKFHHISFTLHSLKDLNELKKLDFKYDYVLLSPVFDSISNVGYNSKLNISAIKSFLIKNKDLTNVIAVGGVAAARIRDVVENNFDGVAILGYMWEEFKADRNIGNALKRYEELLEMVRIWGGVNG